jgi:hypothetical protein
MQTHPIHSLAHASRGNLQLAGGAALLTVLVGVSAAVFSDWSAEPVDLMANEATPDARIAARFGIQDSIVRLNHALLTDAELDLAELCSSGFEGENRYHSYRVSFERVSDSENTLRLCSLGSPLGRDGKPLGEPARADALVRITEDDLGMRTAMVVTRTAPGQ